MIVLPLPIIAHYTPNMTGNAEPHSNLNPAHSLRSGPDPLRRGAMSRRDFFADVIARVRRALPAELAGFNVHANMALLKLHYGNERIHYEVWIDGGRSRVEVGLHFEDGPISTATYLAYFDSRIVEIKHQLGWTTELERWTLSWGHLFESIPLVPLNRTFSGLIADRLIRQISLLQPMVIDADIPAGKHEASPRRRRWERHL